MAKPKRYMLFAVLVSTLLVCGFLALLASRFGDLSISLPVEHKPVFEGETSLYPARLHTNENKLVDANGQVVMLHGMMPPDPAVLARKGRFNRAFFDQMAASGATVMRLPVHPERWERDPDYLWRYLDPAVAWNGENGLYTIIDLHFIGDIGTDRGAQMPDIDTPSSDFAVAFWEQVAAYFKDTPHVIFEIFNEPAEISAKDWQMHAQMLVDVIRGTGAQQLIVIGGVDYSRDLSWVLKMPIDDGNVAYAAHIYPAHSQHSWDRWFGTVSETYPVVLTEWGWLETDPSGKQFYLVGNQERYGESLMKYLDQHGIGWVACWYDDAWQPAMFEETLKSATPFGDFVLQRLAE